MGKVLVVYATRKGSTRNIAELIAEGIRIDGGEAEVNNVTEVKKDEDLAGYDGYVLGSA
ncbi:MAG: flavodoxin domain-containing protein, partial [Deltaproteobacteria bacterium]|nr:flavodoxin domain-containing protein [Deltaproteobacteria bacterium]